MESLYIQKDGKYLKATSLPVLLKDRTRKDTYIPTTLFILEDMTFECFGFHSYEEVLHAIKSEILKSNTISPSNLTILIDFAIAELTPNRSASEKCIALFKAYLINPSKENEKVLRTAYEQRLSDASIFEHKSKDALDLFLKKKKELSKEDREYILNDYFDGEWLLLK